MKQLTGMDASFLYFETAHAPMHIGSFMIYDPSTAPGGFVRFKDILGNIGDRLHLSRAFRQKLVTVPMNLDHPYWVEDDAFDLEFHVRHIALPKPGDWRQLCIQAARLHSRPLDMSKPPWEMYIIEGLDNVEEVPPGSFAGLLKIHHAMIDGVSGSEITEYIHDTEADPRQRPSAQPYQPEPAPTPIELIVRANLNNVTQPLRLLELLNRSLPGFTRMSQGFGRSEFRPVARAPRTRFNRTVTAHRVVDGKAFPLAELRAMKAAVPGATVNDAVISIVGGALNRYLKLHQELPAESLIAMAPVSVRSEGEKGTAGNQVTAMSVEIGSHIDDAAARLRYVFESTSNSKALTRAVGAKNLADYSQFIPSQLAGLASRLMTSPAMREMTAAAQPTFNTTITNIPGPQTPLFFAGARAVKFVGLGPVVDGMALIHPVYSYCGQIAISFTCCREVMPDPEVYADCIEAAYDDLKAATVDARAGAATDA